MAVPETRGPDLARQMLGDDAPVGSLPSRPLEYEIRRTRFDDPIYKTGQTRVACGPSLPKGLDEDHAEG